MNTLREFFIKMIFKKVLGKYIFLKDDNINIIDGKILLKNSEFQKEVK
jgi:hypothetical protein